MKTVLWLVALGLVSVDVSQAQQPKIPHIGYLTAASSPPYDYRSAEGKRDRLPYLAAELVRLKTEIIVADGAGPSLAAKKATSMIPIVMTSTGNPVGYGLVASLARPGGNVT